ncbi:MAG: hypothetical protein ACE5D0_03530 [Fidelibacterota bacterium]
MNQLITLFKREWWEWKRVIFWTIGVFSFLLLLSLVPINRLSNTFESWAEDEKLWFNDEMSVSYNFDDEDLTKKEIEDIKKSLLAIGIDINEEDVGFIDSLVIHHKKTTKEQMSNSPLTVIKPYGYGIMSGFTIIQVLVLFISLFYFSDSLYKERSNDSTLFFRSQPVNDNFIIFSKLKAGGIGIIGLTLAMLMILLMYLRIAILIISGDLWELISEPISQINIFGVFGDLVLIQIVSLLWLSPLILFMMLVSATVSNRPLIVGIGTPILLAITLQIVFGENAFVVQIGDIFGAITKMITSQDLIREMKFVPAGGVDLFGSFWGYLFSVRTLLSLLVDGLFYTATWQMYRKNISTN